MIILITTVTLEHYMVIALANLVDRSGEELTATYLYTGDCMLSSMRALRISTLDEDVVKNIYTKHLHSI